MNVVFNMKQNRHQMQTAFGTDSPCYRICCSFHSEKTGMFDGKVTSVVGNVRHIVPLQTLTAFPRKKTCKVAGIRKRPILS